MPKSVFGVAIYYSPLCLEQTNQPLKVYQRPRWQSARKAALVQKKWTKRWGCARIPCIFKTEKGFFAHPSFQARLEEAVAREQIIRERRAMRPEFYV